MNKLGTLIVTGLMSLGLGAISMAAAPKAADEPAAAAAAPCRRREGRSAEEEGHEAPHAPQEDEERGKES